MSEDTLAELVRLIYENDVAPGKRWEGSTPPDGPPLYKDGTLTLGDRTAELEFTSNFHDFAVRIFDSLWEMAG